jgi:hypothetical protein
VSVGLLGGNPCTRMRLQRPSWGCWWLDSELVEPAELTAGARVTAQIADLTLQGTIVNGYARNGTAGYRVVGGAGGWGRSLPEKSYQNDAGVKLSTVLGDVATAVGETLSGVPTARIAAHFARFAGSTRRPASWILNYFFPRGWYVGDDGTTVIGQRSAAVYVGDGARVLVQPATNVIELDVEQIDNLAPGVTIDGSDPATDVELLLSGSKLRARVYAGASGATSRRMAAWAKLLDAHLPDYKYRGSYEFRVVSQDGERFNLTPDLASIGLDDLELVPVRGPAGYRATVQEGELVMVTFVNAQADRPVIIAHDDPEAPGYVPTQIDIGDQSSTDFLATKAAIDAVQAKLDALITKYNAHVHPTGVGPSGPTTPSETPAGPQPSTDILKASFGA